jgi:iron complex outermembrane receptor protein
VSRSKNVPCRALCAALCLTATIRAQGSAPAPAPAPASHPVLLDEYVASASPFRRNQIDVVQSTTILGERSLLLKQSATLGETLAGEPGMSATAFGPGASRPIIRGLGGDRIRLLENSVGTLDASVTSPDHAVSVEPFLVERIEVVRGPASLLYGSTAVGGLVNVITHRIETELPEERVRGGGEIRVGSGADEFSRGAVLDLSLLQRPGHALVLHLDGFRRSNGDLRIPGFAESARLRAEEAEEAAEHGEPPPDSARDRLPNSNLDTDSGAVGLSLVGRTFHFGASYSGLDTNYGVPGGAHAHAHEDGDPLPPTGDPEPGIRIDLRQRRVSVDGEWRRDVGLVNGLRLKFGHASYRHREIEPDGNVGTLFTNRGYDARLELLHGGAEGWNGALGLQALRNRLTAMGEEAFIPPALTQTNAIFAFEELVRGPLIWQFGGRLDRTRIDPQGGPDFREGELSGSFGAIWKLDDVHSLALSAAHTGRAPNTQELLAHGPHAGTQSFEVGDANLDPERSLGLEISLRRRTGFVTGAVTIFSNRFNGFIFEQPTGLVAIEHEGDWEFLPPDDPEVGEHGGSLPVYQYVQHDARFWGAEVETLWHLRETAGSHLHLKLAADFTRARDDLGNLPRIPAARTTVGLLWARGPWSAGTDCQFVFAQRKVAANETPSDGYALVSADVTWTRQAGRLTYEVFVHGTNLASEEARPHPSFLKELAPLGGRAFSAGVRLRF